MIADIQAIQMSVARVSHYIDGKRWSELRVLFADEVDSDYTSLFGGTPQHKTADELVGDWKKLLGSVTTQHLLGPITAAFADGAMMAECHVRANHYAKGKEWTIDGHYIFEFARHGDAWLITRLKLETYHEGGDRQVVAADT